jgi:hypothetical protein
LSRLEKLTQPLIVLPGWQSNAEVSPEGNWIAYESGESGTYQIYVQPFPDVQAGRWQISTTGGTYPVWARNGAELFYLDRDRRLTAVPIHTMPQFTPGAPATILAGQYFAGLPTRTFDVSPDAQRLLMLRNDASHASAAASIVVALNWFDELKARVPK